jgi:hypothetical protein
MKKIEPGPAPRTDLPKRLAVIATLFAVVGLGTLALSAYRGQRNGDTEAAAVATQSTEDSLAELAELRARRAAKAPPPTRSPWKAWQYIVAVGPYDNQPAADDAAAALIAAHPKTMIISGPPSSNPDSVSLSVVVEVFADEAAATALTEQLAAQGYPAEMTKHRPLREDLTREELLAVDEQLAAEHEKLRTEVQP